MSNILLVPIHLDALVLDRDQTVVEATADFSRLPFCTGKRDINPDIANISEQIVSTPFQNENLLLKKGIHLHWSLPDALTRARPNPDSPQTQDFPRVPNRWLVTRCDANGVVEKELLIESDYLFPTLEGNVAGTGVPMPYRKDQRQPFRFMGRRVEWSDPSRDKGEYYPKLTAVGYGEPAFAAFYPNCHSVFGFFDEEYSGNNDQRQYYVVGWYSDIKEDALRIHVRDALLFQPSDFTNLGRLAIKLRDHADAITQYLYNNSLTAQSQLNAYSGAGDPPEALRKVLLENLNRVLKAGTDELYKPDRFPRVTPETLALVQKRLLGHESVYVNRKLLEEAFPAEIAPRSPALPRILEDKFKWTFTNYETVEFPIRMFCYARLTLGQRQLRAPHGPTTVAIGNSGTEALSACMATKLPSNAPRRKIEDQLEALHLAPTLEHRQLDVAAKFVEGRHEKGFAAVAGGTLWTVQAESSADSPADARATPITTTLPDRLGRLLNTINKCQSDYDRAWQAIESLRVQLFSDWYKYMLCAYPPPATREAYPDIDKVASYIDQRRASLHERLTQAGTVALNETGGRVVAQLTSGGDKSPASALAKAVNELQALLDSQTGTMPAYKLKQTSGPRYWRPTEPSVLVDGTKADPSKRHGHDGRPKDGLLETQILSSTTWPNELTQLSLRNIREGIAKLPNTENIFAFKKWAGQPWNPFLLEWEVEVFPLEHKSNIDPATGHYDKDFIAENYQLAENDVDLSLRPGRGAWTMAANRYSGRSILTPHATEQLGRQAESYIQKQVLPQFYSTSNALRSHHGSEDLASVIKAARHWYETSKKSPRLRAANSAEDPTITAFQAWTAIKDPETPDPDCLSQSLSGFNDALLMHKQTLQLHVADPLGFGDYQPFAQRVGEAISNSIYTAPTPQNDFNPIRSGMMKIHRLRIIDTFGQVEDLDVKGILPSESLVDGTGDPLINLPPRLLQPARINFRWLSAAADQQEMNDHPTTTPICGWVLANHLDDSLMIYDNTGKALGSLVKRDGRAAWLRAPGGRGVHDVKEISNHHLQQMVTTIKELGAEFLEDFVTAIDSAVENIEPETFARHQDLALLMGRPLALVRASLNLELKGLPASHQGWNEFRQDMERETRDDNGFTSVRFPIRIGEYKQFNDGTVGYWRETTGGYENKVFFAPQSDQDVKFESAHLKTHRTDPEDMVFYQTVDSQPQILSLLIDPRGVVHATTGILPVKAINIPPDQYAAALQAIEITFLSTPVLTDTGKIHLPLPEEAGYQWSWLQKNFADEWSEVSSRGLVEKQTFAAASQNDGHTFWDAEIVWQDLKDQGWIELLDPKDDTRASVTAKDSRTSKTLSPDLKDITDKIEDILDRAHIGPVDQSAKFSGPQEIREGWLKLSPAAPQPGK